MNIETNELNFQPDNSVVGYKGIVKVIIKKGEKIVKTKIYENNGVTALFDTICKLLAGEASPSELPGCIRLFTCSAQAIAENTPVSVATKGWLKTLVKEEFDSTVSDSETARIFKSCSENIPYSAVPLVNPNSKALAGASEIVFQFKVPFDLIKYNPDSQEKLVYAMALMPRNFNAKGEKALAYYLFTDSGLWDPINFTTASRDFSLYIEWSMSFANK